MPPILKPKPNVITKAAEAIKSKSPLPKIINDVILPTEDSGDVMGIPTGGALEPAISAGANLISPLVSIYRNKAEREAATKAFYDSVVSFARKFMPSGEHSGWVSAAKDLVDTHPRVAAHMAMSEAPATGTSNLSKSGNFAAAMDWNPLAQRTGLGELHLHSTAIPEVDRSTSTAREYMRHEATHAAQALGDPGVPQLYSQAHRLVGYERNPYEMSARYAGGTARGGLKSSAQVPVSPGRFQEKVAKKLQSMGISLDLNSRDGVSLRKWGMPKEPANAVDIQSLDPKLQDQLMTIHKRMLQPYGYEVPVPFIVGHGTNPGKASVNMKNILDSKRTGINGTALDKAYQYLARRTEKP